MSRKRKAGSEDNTSSTAACERFLGRLAEELASDVRKAWVRHVVAFDARCLRVGALHAATEHALERGVFDWVKNGLEDGGYSPLQLAVFSVLLLDGVRPTLLAECFLQADVLGERLCNAGARGDPDSETSAERWLGYCDWCEDQQGGLGAVRWLCRRLLAGPWDPREFALGLSGAKDPELYA